MKRSRNTKTDALYVWSRVVVVLAILAVLVLLWALFL